MGLFYSLISNVEVRPDFTKRCHWLPVCPENFPQLCQRRCFSLLVEATSAAIKICVSVYLWVYADTNGFGVSECLYWALGCLFLLLSLSRLMSRLRSCCRKPELGQMSLCSLTTATASCSLRSSAIIRKASTKVAERLTPIRQCTNTRPGTE